MKHVVRAELGTGAKMFIANENMFIGFAQDDQTLGKFLKDL
jgi:hypothetical protein